MRAASFKTWACRSSPKKTQSHKLGPRCRCPSTGVRGADDKVLLTLTQPMAVTVSASRNRHSVARHLWDRMVSLGGARSMLLTAIITLCHRCHSPRNPVSRTQTHAVSGDHGSQDTSHSCSSPSPLHLSLTPASLPHSCSSPSPLHLFHPCSSPSPLQLSLTPASFLHPLPHTSSSHPPQQHSHTPA